MIAAVAASCAAFLLLSVAFGRASQAVPALPADGDFLSWEPRGGLAGDRSFVDRAVAAWRAEEEIREPTVRVLWAGTDPVMGAVAVLQARGADGVVRAGVLAGTRSGGARDVALLAAEPIRDPGATRQISVVDREPPATRRDGDGSVAIALAEPGARVDGFESWAWDSYRGDAGRDDAPLAVEVVPEQASPTNTRVVVKQEDATVYDGPVSMRGHDDRHEGGRVGAAVVDYLPPRARRVGASRVRSTDAGTLRTQRFSTPSGWVEVAELQGANASLEALKALLMPGSRSFRATPHALQPMRMLMTDNLVGFAWAEGSERTYAVVATDEMEAYGVALGTTTAR